MAYEASAAALFMAFFALLQLWLGAKLLINDQGPAQTFFALLLIANGIVTAGLTGMALEPVPSWAPAVLVLADTPTGTLLLLLAAALWKRRDGIHFPWTPGWRTAFAAAATLAAVQAVAYLISPTFHLHVVQMTYGSPTLFAAYGVLFIVIARRLARAEGWGESRYWMLMLVAFGTRAVEFAWQFGIETAPARIQALVDGPVLSAIQAPFVLALPFAVAWGTIALVVVAIRRGTPHARNALAALAILGSALVSAIALSTPHEDALGWYILSMLSLVAIRPIAGGLAMDTPTTISALAGTSSITGLFLATKATLSAMLHVPYLQVTDLDILAAALTVVLATTYWAIGGTTAVHPLRSHAEDSTPSRGAGARPQPKPTNAHRLAAALLDADWLNHADLLKRTGITPNNVAGEVRRLERMLSPYMDADEAENAIQVETRGVRGRKHYALSPQGAHAAGRLMERDRLDAGTILQRHHASSDDSPVRRTSTI